MKIVETKNKLGIVFKGLFSEPEIISKKIIIHIHGMAGSVVLNRFYQSMHEGYTKSGFAFLAGENSGTGTITEFISETEPSGVKVVGNAFEKFEDCVDDISSWIEFAKQLGYDEIWLQGHSLGTSKIAYYMNFNKVTDIKGLILLSPCDMVGLVHDPEDQKEHDILYPEAKKLVSEGSPNQLLSKIQWGSNYLSAATYLNFFEDTSKTAIFNYGNPSLGWGVVNNIKIPVIAITGTKDDGIVPVMDPIQTMELLKKELKNSPRVESKIYENCYHSFDGFADEIVKDVLLFISTN